jgi:hypothetical protein
MRAHARRHSGGRRPLLSLALLLALCLAAALPQEADPAQDDLLSAQAVPTLGGDGAGGVAAPTAEAAASVAGVPAAPSPQPWEQRIGAAFNSTSDPLPCLCPTAADASASAASAAAVGADGPDSLAPQAAVCGADGVTYASACLAGCASTTVSAEGDCEAAKARVQRV